MAQILMRQIYTLQDHKVERERSETPSDDLRASAKQTYPHRRPHDHLSHKLLHLQIKMCAPRLGSAAPNLREYFQWIIKGDTKSSTPTFIKNTGYRYHKSLLDFDIVKGFWGAAALAVVNYQCVWYKRLHSLKAAPRMPSVTVYQGTSHIDAVLSVIKGPFM
ncbi:hypothetical protein BDQ12DRAFT_668075 [Crucibulum laeve]|uniref:Uncharacterized protein n=1 Tax=Crucibulum laeve TaxID=68775 RepID=A0A5C3LW60_9AGAR|nr:hypothetical protein BDQ12DRAFT_668075 [Crucibulum laeve]